MLVLGHAITCVISHGEHIGRFCMASLGRQTITLQCLAKILGDTATLLVDSAQFKQCQRIPLLCSQSIPVGSHQVILQYTLT